MKKISLLWLGLAALALSSCADNTKIEAEKAELHGTRVATNIEGFSGTGYIQFNAYAEGYALFNLKAPEDGEYALKLGFVNATDSTSKSAVKVEIDEAYICTQKLEISNEFTFCYANSSILLTKGKHVVKVTGFKDNWGLDYVELVPMIEEIKAEVSPAKLPVTKNASKEAVALYNYLCSMQGKGILSGQQIYSTMTEIDAIEELTGKTPAVLGIDLIDYSPSRVEHGAKGNVIRRAKLWWKNGGIITCAWHWNAPKDLLDLNEPEKHWYDGFRTGASTFDFSIGIKDHESEEYQLMLRDIDAIAEQLKSLQAAGIPILWRPLHEASGRWFWWGSKGAKNYIELYKLVYDRLVNYHGLDNLIWVWNAQDPDWYPGDEYVDVISYDCYPGKHSYQPAYDKLQLIQSATTQNKLCAISENGTLPDVDALAKDKAGWSWFCTWNGEFVIDGSGNYSGTYTEAEAIKRFYENPYLITLDELPSFK